jgi:hypothetical protein
VGHILGSAPPRTNLCGAGHCVASPEKRVRQNGSVRKTRQPCGADGIICLKYGKCKLGKVRHYGF